VRELDNVIQRALILRKGPLIDADSLHFEHVGGSAVIQTAGHRHRHACRPPQRTRAGARVAATGS
jgi:DNA-binding NtrC family response regulator